MRGDTGEELKPVEVQRSRLMGLALLARTPAESPKAANARSVRGVEPRRTEFDSQGQHAVSREAKGHGDGRGTCRWLDELGA